ncbi:MAG: histidine kinase dimerization/phospho-acceptor domain-containing protein, partial [Nannocystaceae bacterium]
LIHEEDRSDVLDETRRVFEGGAPEPIDYRIIRPIDGEIRRVQVTSRVFRDEDGSVTTWLGTARDVTTERDIEQRLHHSQKMEAIGRLASGVSHDFNNILTVIRGLAFILQDALPPDHEEQGTVEELDRAAQRAAGLTRQLLVFSRRKDTASIELHVGQVLAELNRMLRRLVPASIELAFEYADDLAPANADPGQVEHLIAVLAVRAKERGTQAGLLHFSTKNVAVDGIDRAALIVYDDGFSGTAAQIAEFNEQQPGRAELVNALDLGDVVSTCERAGASLSLVAHPKGGVAVQIVFPAVPSPSAASKTQAAQDLPQLHGTETILLAEDEASLRTLVAAGLRRYGYDVLSCGNPVEAKEVAATHTSPIDLLITDIVMPHGTGAELASALRVENP